MINIYCRSNYQFQSELCGRVLPLTSETPATAPNDNGYYQHSMSWVFHGHLPAANWYTKGSGFSELMVGCGGKYPSSKTR